MNNKSILIIYNNGKIVQDCGLVNINKELYRQVKEKLSHQMERGKLKYSVDISFHPADTSDRFGRNCNMNRHTNHSRR